MILPNKSTIKTGISLIKNMVGIRTPVFLQLKPTFKCNMKCEFCNLWQENIKEADTQTFKKIIKDTHNLGASTINFSGGEPFIRKDIIELIIYAKKTGYITLINSNGYTSHKYLNQLKNSIDYLTISLDFPVEKQHDTFRNKKGAFNNAIKTIKLASKLKINTKINCTVTAQNISQMEEMAELAKSLNTKISLTPVQIDFTPGTKNLKDTNQNINTLKLDLNQYIATIIQLKKKYNNINTPNYFLKHIKSLQKNKKQQIKCKATNTVINVLPNGKAILPCEIKNLKQIEASNISKLYYSKEFKHISKQNGKYSFCNKCYSQCTLTPTLLTKPRNIIEHILFWS